MINNIIILAAHALTPWTAHPPITTPSKSCHWAHSICCLLHWWECLDLSGCGSAYTQFHWHSRASQSCMDRWHKKHRRPKAYCWMRNHLLMPHVTPTVSFISCCDPSSSQIPTLGKGWLCSPHHTACVIEEVGPALPVNIPRQHDFTWTLRDDIQR